MDTNGREESERNNREWIRLRWAEAKHSVID